MEPVSMSSAREKSAVRSSSGNARAFSDTYSDRPALSRTSTESGSTSIALASSDVSLSPTSGSRVTVTGPRDSACVMIRIASSACACT